MEPVFIKNEALWDKKSRRAGRTGRKILTTVIVLAIAVFVILVVANMGQDGSQVICSTVGCS